VNGDPDKIILASIALAGGILTWRGVRTGSLTPRTYAGLGVVAVMLLGLGAFAPPLASALAVLVLVVVLLTSQEDIASLVDIGGSRRG
jgi:CHASE2 domain-containing sensor protein